MRKYALKINDKKFDLEVKSISAEKAEIEVNGKVYKVAVDDIISDLPKPKVRTLPSTPPNTPKAKAPKQKTEAKQASGKGAVIAPIPGSILSINVKEGDTVSAGQPVLKMEAMKMENEIAAPKGGTVSAIYVAVGDAVSQGTELVIIS